MRLVTQTKLFFKQGTSDKIYEVDLCEAGPGEFIVNFRYGRRGSRLKEGTKTPFPESRSTAENIAAKLISEKKAKGYLLGGESGAPAPQSPTRSSEPQPDASDPRVNAVIARLAKGKAPDKWKLSRAIWRAAQWNLTSAAPHLRNLLPGASGIDAWCLAWALGRCGGPEDIPLLETLITSNPSDSALSAIAREAMLPHLNDAGKTSLFTSIRASLPPEILAALETQDVSLLTAALQQAVESNSVPKNLTADLFLLAKEQNVAREALYSLGKTIGTAKNGMLVLRQLFKAAEFRLDAEIYGTVAKRFELDPPRSARPFSSRTRLYFKKRIWRQLQTAGEENDATTFITLATGILLAYDDSTDGQDAHSTVEYTWDSTTRRSNRTEIHHPARARSLSFHWLLRGNSPDLKRSPASLVWTFVGNPSEATTREEVFPHLWDAAPEAITHLLTRSRAAAVQDFAIRIWEAHPAWADDTELEFVIELLSSWYLKTARIGVSLAEKLWSSDAPDGDLILALLESEAPEARQLGATCLTQIRYSLPKLPDLVLRLAFARNEASRDAVRTCLAATILPPENRKTFVASAISGLLSLNEDDASQAIFTTEILRLLAERELENLPLPHVSELLVHPLEALQLLAVRILLAQRSPASLPEPILLAPLSSSFPSVRELGLTLLNSLSGSELSQRSETLAACAVSPHPDLRANIGPLISRIAATNSTFARDLVLRWYPLVLRKETYEGLHADIFHMLSGPLEKALGAIPPDSFPRMLRSDYPQAQALGFILLKRNADLAKTDFLTLRDWAVHPHAELRAHIWKHFRSHREILTENLSAILPLLESTWPDCSEAAFDFCRDDIPESAWTPEALVSICDSIRPTVQDFGREMITRRFHEEDGPFYLARLSQHPSTALQIFASNYLLRYAAGQPDRIATLEPYFRTVLGKIGAGRTAKNRVFALLEKEGLSDQSTANLVAELLTRISATIAIEDKARCITILREIALKWPDVSTPLSLVQPTLKGLQHAL